MYILFNLPQQQEIANDYFVIVYCCGFVIPFHTNSCGKYCYDSNVYFWNPSRGKWIVAKWCVQCIYAKCGLLIKIVFILLFQSVSRRTRTIYYDFNIMYTVMLCTVMPSSVIIRLFERIFGYACSLWNLINFQFRMDFWIYTCDKRYVASESPRNIISLTDNAWDKSQ